MSYDNSMCNKQCVKQTFENDKVLKYKLIRFNLMLVSKN